MNACIFVLILLSFPNSNAGVERIFSATKNIKTDIRNQIDIDTIEACIYIKEYFKSSGIDAKDLIITKKMASKFCNDMYA